MKPSRLQPTTPALAGVVLSALLLAGCSTNSNSAYVKAEPTYEDAQKNHFVNANRDAVQKLLTGLDIKEYQRTPMLVATVVPLPACHFPSQ